MNKSSQVVCTDLSCSVSPAEFASSSRMVPPDLPAVPYGSPGHVNRSQEMLIWSYHFICHAQCGYSLETSCFHLRDFDIVDTEIARWVQLVWKSLDSGIFNSPFRTSRVVLVQAAGVKKQTVIFENPFFSPLFPSCLETLSRGGCVCLQL